MVFKFDVFEYCFISYCPVESIQILTSGGLAEKTLPTLKESVHKNKSFLVDRYKI